MSSTTVERVVLSAEIEYPTSQAGAVYLNGNKVGYISPIEGGSWSWQEYEHHQSGTKNSAKEAAMEVAEQSLL